MKQLFNRVRYRIFGADLNKMSVVQRNEWFKSLSTDKQRVEIAKDVLQQLDTKKYIATKGRYFVPGKKESYNEKWNDFEEGVNSTQYESLQCAIDSPDVACQTCAMGAVFASRVRLGNEINSYRPDSRKVVNALEGIFTREELKLMEVMFEGYEIDPMYTFDDTAALSRALEFFRDNTDTKLDANANVDRRLRLIMQSIIDSKGKFVL